LILKIENAKLILTLQEKFGSFEDWLEHHHSNAKAEWVKLFKKTFRFTGGEIVNLAILLNRTV
jgi:DNA-3-methyladenine glycosylase I